MVAARTGNSAAPWSRRRSRSRAAITEGGHLTGTGVAAPIEIGGRAGRQRPRARGSGHPQRRRPRPGARRGARRAAGAARRRGRARGGAGAPARAPGAGGEQAGAPGPRWCWRSARATRSRSPRWMRSARPGWPTSWRRRTGCSTARRGRRASARCWCGSPPGASEIDPRTARRRASPARSPALLAAGGAGTLFACGGETDRRDSRASSASASSRVEGELLPGVPVSRMVVNGQPMRLVTKSGGFGASDTLISVVEGVQRGDKEGRR